MTGVNGSSPAIGSAILPLTYRIGPGYVRWTIALPKQDSGRFVQLRFGVYNAYQIAYASYSKRIR